MPRLKSPVNLLDLCWFTVLENIDQLEQQVERLPPVLTNELFRQFYTHFVCWRRHTCSHKIPTKLFIRPTTKELHALQFFDIPEDEVFKEIRNTCTQLRKLIIRIGFIEVIRDNPNLVYLDLCGSQVTNMDLSIISEHCPQLMNLVLLGCRNVTNDGMQYLPRKIKYLNLHHTNVSENGCVAALNSLQLLVKLEHANWSKILRLLYGENEDKIYSIEKLKITIDEQPNFDFCSLVTRHFPKLQYLDISCTYLNRRIFNTLTNSTIKYNITTLAMYGAPNRSDVIKMVGYLCPMLREFRISFSENTRDEEVDIIQSLFETLDKHVLFKHLHNLSVDFRKLSLPIEDLKLLLKNCHNLMELRIIDHDAHLSERMIEIIAINPLRCLKSLIFLNCSYLSTDCVITTLKSLPCVKKLYISRNTFSQKEFEIIQDTIQRCNWDVKFSFDGLTTDPLS